MLTLLGIGTVAALLLLILFRITSVLVALTLVPLAAALIGGFAGSFGTWAMDGIRGVTPVAALLAFAVIYFGVMNDAGLFDPIIRALVGVVGTDPVRIALGTAAVASVAHLDGEHAAVGRTDDARGHRASGECDAGVRAGDSRDARRHGGRLRVCRPYRPA
jgi:CitMHS family citrate-Mg2+:H+ or citrate-Ca2+:H+ symporter